MDRVLSAEGPAVARWRTAYASVIGTSHAATGAPCQDAGSCQVVVAHDGSEILLAAVADGAGSAPKSQEGADLAVASFHSEFGPLAAADPSLASFDRGCLTGWFDQLRNQLGALADTGAHHLSEFACTFLAAVVGPERAVFMQIGDGAIVVTGAEDGDYSWMFWPQHGEFANTTNFVTQQDYDSALEVEVVEGHLDEIAIFSDGIERLVLDLSSRTVHSPALRPIFKWLAGTDPDSAAPGAAPGLVAFLASDGINRRTDDDKTLVMATRAAAAVA